MNNKIFFLIGPSGVGKSTVRKYIESKYPNIKYIPSFTTRQPRPGEIHGKDYLFISASEFLYYRDNNLLIEWENHFENYYGISYDYCESNLATNSLIKEIAIDGYMQILVNSKLSKEHFNSIFIYPDDLRNLTNRLKDRGDKDITTRIRSIKDELKTSEQCDFVITSIEGELDKLLVGVESIILKLLDA